MSAIINPWSSQQFKDYIRLRNEFGIEEFKFNLPEPPAIFRRGVIFGHRGFEYIYERIRDKKNFGVLTGLMPSGRMHLGHKMTIDQVKYYQSLGADVHIAVADIESYASRGISLEKAKKLAMEEYIPSYIALGLNPENMEVYFQSQRKEVKDLAWEMGKKINLNEFTSIYGFKETTNMTHVFSPLIQVGDILHIQLDKFGGRRPTIVPVGVDQDPHIRLTRTLVDRWRMFSILKQNNKIGIFYKGEDSERRLKDLKEILESSGFDEIKVNIPYKALYVSGNYDIIKIDDAVINYEKGFNDFCFYAPAATYHRLMTGLTGDKMSSSMPESAIFLSDKPEEAVKKVKNAITGGRTTLQEQRKYGGVPGKCSIYELFVYHLIDDDKRLTEIYEDCRNGTRACGACKKEASNILSEFLVDFQEKREKAKDYIKDVVSLD